MKKNRGFTLVELIVVLVILAILAAVLVPALLGYIDKARNRKYLNNAKAAMDAAQAQLVEEYAKRGSSIKVGDNVIGASKATKKDTQMEEGSAWTNGRNGDVDARKSQFAKDVLTLIGKENDPPFCFYIGVGSNCDQFDTYNSKVTAHDKFTVFFAFYKETKDAAPLYYYNGEWSLKNPRWTGSNSNTEFVDYYNVFTSGPQKGKRVQYYLISETQEAYNYYGGSFSLNDGTMWGNLKKDDDEF